MGFMQGVKDGWNLFKDSVSLLFKKPVFLIPIILSWVVFASVILYLKYYFESPASFLELLLYIYIAIFLITFFVCLGNLMMLEIIQQIESGEEVSFFKALKEVFTLDLFKVIPIAVIWAILWLIITVLRALTKNKHANAGEPSARGAARTLGGADETFSWGKAGLSVIEKMIRMTIFLSLPAIAWENKGPLSSIKQSYNILKEHYVQFATSYTLTGIASMLMALPLIPIFMMDDAGYIFSSTFWFIVIIYECIIWTLAMYLEQMTMSLLYLWHLRWVKNGSKGDLSSVPRPELLDGIYELKRT